MAEGLETVEVDYWDIGERDCHVCVVVDVIAKPSERIALAIAGHLQPLVGWLWHNLFALWLIASFAAMAFGRANLPKLAAQFLIGLFITAVLESMNPEVPTGEDYSSISDTGNLWFDYIYVPIRDISVNLSIELISWTVDIGAKAAGVTLEGEEAGKLPLPANAGELAEITKIFALIENSVFNIITSGFAAVEGVFAIVPFLQAVILALPFIFVAMIFAAFILETNFKWLAVTALSPFFVMAAFFPTMPRSWTLAAIRLYFSGAFTIIFASMAMAFTIAVTEKYRASFICNATFNDAACRVAGTTAAEAQAAQEAESYFTIDGLFGTWAFWVILFLGLVSVLLHLKAPTLASNISGANDSAAPAAAVTAAGKMAAGGAIMTTMKYSGVPLLKDKAGGKIMEKGGVPAAAARGALAATDAVGRRMPGGMGPSDYFRRAADRMKSARSS